tara:strand:- start:374 stop:655 length:282 start_codon:yes stop_codon:yes gene_type:complete
MSKIEEETEVLGKDIRDLYEKTYYLVHKGMEQHKAMHDINTFQAHANEIYLRGKDERGEDFTIVFDAFDFLEWIDKDQIDYIKEQLTKYIETK